MGETMRPPRFPVVAALLCAACIGAAACTWMRYSYAWEVTVKALNETGAGAEGCYAEVFGRLERDVSHHPMDGAWHVFLDVGANDALDRFDLWENCPSSYRRVVCVAKQGAASAKEGPVSLAGRIHFLWSQEEAVGEPTMLVGASRFHGASIAGLVVGAMGVFVFSVALRSWLAERRHCREPH